MGRLSGSSDDWHNKLQERKIGDISSKSMAESDSEEVQTMAAAIAKAAMEKLVPQMNMTIERQVAAAVKAALPEPSSTPGQPYGWL